MKAVILARVSTKEQEDGHSLAAQKQRLAEYCQRKNLNVIKVFEIIESSTKGKRKELRRIHMTQNNKSSSNVNTKSTRNLVPITMPMIASKLPYLPWFLWLHVPMNFL